MATNLPPAEPAAAPSARFIAVPFELLWLLVDVHTHSVRSSESGFDAEQKIREAVYRMNNDPQWKVPDATQEGQQSEGNQ